MNERALATTKATDLAPSLGYSIDINRVVAQKMAVQECMSRVMKKDEHYGVIPGTQKPTLYQPGADVLCLLFRIRPEYEIVSHIERDDFIAFTVRCRLYNIQDSNLIGEGCGSGNSREAKYTAQSTAKKCPTCKAPAIIKGKEEYGGGWVCFKKKNGCGAKFKDDDKAITGQTGEVLVTAVWDLHNTILKMANKRAKVAAILTATAASDCFTQDLEDLGEVIDLPVSQQMPTSTRGQRQDKAAPVKTCPACEWALPDCKCAQMRDDAPPPSDDDAPPVAGVVDVIDHKTGEVKSVAKVTKAQLAKIHILKAEGRWGDEQWQRTLKQAYGVSTSALMSKDQATHWIEKLERKNDAAEHAIKAVGDAIEALASSPEQIQELGVEFARLGWTHKQCSGWLSEYFKVSTRSELSSKQAINALQRLMLLDDTAKP